MVAELNWSIGKAPSPQSRGNKLLATVPRDDFQRILPQLTVVPIKFKQVLYTQDEPIRHVFFPSGGACSLMKVMGNGKTAEIATIGSEGVLGAAVFFGDGQSFGETVVQIADGDGWRMPVEAFVAEMARRGPFYNRIIRYLQALRSQVIQTTVCNGIHSVEQRCCRWLLAADDRVRRDHLRLTHELLSTMLGVRRPTVTTVLGELQRARLLEQRRRMIHLRDRMGLELAACDCYGTIKTTFDRLLPEIRQFGSSRSTRTGDRE